MITNELQLKVSKANVRKFAATLKAQIADTQVDALTRQMGIDALESEIQSLQAEIKAYEQIKDGLIRELSMSFHDIGGAIALARAAAGLTQDQLAEQLGVKGQQIQRNEADNYARTSLAKIQEVVAMLDTNIVVTITFANNKVMPAAIGKSNNLRLVSSNTTSAPTRSAPTRSWDGMIDKTKPASIDGDSLEPSKSMTAMLAAK